MEENKNFFDRANEWIRDVEASFVNLISALAPWGAPLPVAFMSGLHMRDVLQFPWMIYWPTAIVIEILGFSTVSTGLAFWSHNRRYSSSASLKRAPLELVVIAFIFYLMIVVSMNVIIDAAPLFFPVAQFPQSQAFAIIVVRALLTLLSIPAALVLATRTQHHDLLDQIKQEKWERKFGKVRFTELAEPTGKKQVAMSFIDSYVSTNNVLPALDKIMSAAGIVKSSASQFRAEWVKLHGVIEDKNGK